MSHSQVQKQVQKIETGKPKIKKRMAAVCAIALTFAFAFVFFGASTTSAATMPWSGNGAPGQGQQGGRPGMQGFRGGMPMRPAVFGSVTAVNGSSITVQGENFGRASTTPGAVYTVDASNATVIKNNATSSVSSIVVGDKITVQGTVSGSSVVAKVIVDGMQMPGGRMGPGMMGNPANRPAVVGTVASVSGSTLTVTSKGFGKASSTTSTYTVDAGNAVVTKNGATSTISSVVAGDEVAITGTVNGSSVTATMVRDGMGQRGENPEITGNGQPIVAGTVSSVNGSSLVITNKSNVQYTVDASNAKIEKGNVASSVSSIAVGDSVVAQGTINGTSVSATTVFDQAKPSSTQGGQNGNKGSLGGFFGAIGGFFSHLFGF